MTKNKKSRVMILSVIMFLLICAPIAFSDTTAAADRVREVSLDAELKKGIFGLPEGIKEPGCEAYVDFDTDTITYREYEGAPPSEWDIVFTYVVKSVSMGPMGTHPVPYFALRANKQGNVVFFTTEDEYESIKGVTFPSVTLDRYEFEAEKKLEYTAPAETFIFSTTGNKIVKLLFTSIKGKNKNNRLFSAVFLYSGVQLKE